MPESEKKGREATIGRYGKLKEGIMTERQLNRKSFGLINWAIERAVVAHHGQVRKGTELPYITHPFGVAVLLCRAGCADEVVIAGILHDTTEDTTLTLEEIYGQFKQEVKRVFGT